MPDPAKIVFVITGLSVGGAENMLYKLLSVLDRSKYAPEVVCLVGQGCVADDIRELGVPVHFVNMQSGLAIPGFVRLVRLLKRLKPDLLQGWMSHANLAATLARYLARLRAPLIWNVRLSQGEGGPQKISAGLVVRAGALCSEIPQRIIYNAGVSAAQHEKLGYRREKTVILPNGFDCAVFRPSATARRNLRAELGLSENALLIGLIARFDPLKDHATFFRAAALLSQTQPAVRYVLAGTAVDPANAALMRMVRENGVEEHVSLLGERYDVPDVTAALDLATSSSLSEAFANTIGEAMACGVPVVATSVGDSASIVADTGITVPSRNPSALADAWRMLIEAGAGRRAALGVAARNRVQQVYSLETIAKRYEALYDTALGTSGDSEALQPSAIPVAPVAESMKPGAR